MVNNELTHYGILGMKWGVRRYQNKDGTLTAAGKKRRAESEPVSEEEMSARIRKHNVEKQYNKMLEEQEPPSKLDRTKKVVDASNDMVNKTKNAIKSSKTKTKMDLSDMTDQQLREKINRANLERQYNDLFGTEEVSIGEKYALRVLDIAGDILSIGGSAVALALTIKQIRGKG